MSSDFEDEEQDSKDLYYRVVTKRCKDRGKDVWCVKGPGLSTELLSGNFNVFVNRTQAAWVANRLNDAFDKGRISVEEEVKTFLGRFGVRFEK